MEAHYQEALDQSRFQLSFLNQRLEDEFRYETLVRESARLRVQLLLGALFIIGITFVDYLLAPFEFFSYSARIRFSLMLPTIFAMMVLSTVSASERVMIISGVCVGLSVGLGSLFIGLSAPKLGAPAVFSGYFVVTVYIYYFLGLRTWIAGITAGTLVIAYFLVIFLYVDQISSVIIYNAMFLVFLNLLCIVGAYQFESSRRLEFLKECMLKIRANTDGMTLLANRGAFDTRLPELWQECVKRHTRLSLLMVDIDFFKQYNDHYGHQKGDDTIRAVADVLQTIANRPNDLVCRYGGEEFAIVLFDSDESYAKLAAKQLCTRVTSLRIPHKGSRILSFVSISVGVSSVSPHSSQRTIDGFIQSADEALYAAKQQGRNRSVARQAGINESEETGVFKVTQWST